MPHLRRPIYDNVIDAGTKVGIATPSSVSLLVTATTKHVRGLKAFFLAMQTFLVFIQFPNSN